MIRIHEVRINYDDDQPTRIRVHTGQDGEEVFEGVVEDGRVLPERYLEIEEDSVEHSEVIESFPELKIYNVIEGLGFDV